MAAYLIDTHILLRWYDGSRKLTKPQIRLLRQAEGRDGWVGVSPISFWEIAFLAKHGKIKIPEPLEGWLDQIESDSRVHVLPITAAIAADASRFGSDFPTDPNDRIILATARHHRLKLLTSDTAIRECGKVEVV